MDIKRLAPWNWFKDEEKSESRTVPVRASGRDTFHPIAQLHHEIDRVFDSVLGSFGFPSLRGNGGSLFDSHQPALLRPSVDIAASEKEYLVTVEVPGVNETDIQLELIDDALIVRGEKKQEREEKQKDYYRVERSYGAFKRVLTLPEDANREAISAKCTDGVVTITLPRVAVIKPQGKLIEIRKTA